jgi:hypothetical protein
MGKEEVAIAFMEARALFGLSCDQVTSYVDAAFENASSDAGDQEAENGDEEAEEGGEDEVDMAG